MTALRTALVAGLLAAGMLGACKRGAYSLGAGATAAEAEPDLSDGNILALLDHANQADSAAAAVAATKGSDGRVRRARGAALASKLDLTPQPPAEDPVTGLAQQEMDALESAEQGRNFDRTYVEHRIRAHEAVLELVERSLRSAGNAELRTLIQRTRPLLQAHLQRARLVLGNLTGV